MTQSSNNWYVQTWQTYVHNVYAALKEFDASCYVAKCYVVVPWTSLSMLPCRLGFIKRGIEAQYNKWPQIKNFDFQLNILYWDWLLLWSNILLLPVYFESVWAFYATSWVLTCIGRALHCFPFGPVGLGFIKRAIGAQYKDMRDVDLKYWVHTYVLNA